MSKMKHCPCGRVHAADEVRAKYRFVTPCSAYVAVGVLGSFPTRADAQLAVCPYWVTPERNY